MKEIFSKNLKQAREGKGWKQEGTAKAIGVTRQAYGAWEEGRSFPTEGDLITVAKIFGISDLIGFISNDKFDIHQQIQQAPKQNPKVNAASMIEEKYRKAGIKEQLVVNILLGLVDLTEGI